MTDPHSNGLSEIERRLKCELRPSDGVLEMLKVSFCLMLATWMAGCLMMVVYSREIAHFIAERMMQ